MPAGIRVAVDVSPRGQLRDAHAAEREPAQQLDGGDRIALLLRDEIRVRRLLRAERDLIAPGLVAVEQQRLLVLRRVLDAPTAMPFPCSQPRRAAATSPAATGSNRGSAAAGRACSAGKSSMRVFVRRRVLVERRLGPERRDVLEVRRVVDVAGIPRVEAGAHVRGADLPALLQALSRSPCRSCSLRAT